MKIKLKHLYLLSTIIITFIFFVHTLNYQWKYFDEQIIFNETVLPIASSFSQIFEYIYNFGPNNCFEASNPFYSTISNTRCDPVNSLIILFVSFFIKKNVVGYHLLSLALHLFNTLILFLLLHKVRKEFLTTANTHLSLLIVSILTLFWSLNPLNVESILFAVNWSAILTYSLCLALVFCFVNLEKLPKYSPILIFVLYLVPLFNSEYSITLPLILFCYSYAKEKSLNLAFKRTLPLFAGLVIFLIYFFLSPTKENIHYTSSNPISVTLERIFWFSPQIFFHFIKLVLFPSHLSIDQSTLVKLSKTLLDPYSIFCVLFMWSIILILILSFFSIKNRLSFFFFISLSLFLCSLLPFLHILSPAYCLCSERYLYFPLFMLIFGISHAIFFVFSRIQRKGVACYALTSMIFCITLISGARSYMRTLDWKDSVSLFKSAVSEAKNDLSKAFRLEMLGAIVSSSNNYNSYQEGKKYFDQAQDILIKSVLTLKDEEQKYGEVTPKILKVYGLDPKTLQAKAAYLIALKKSGLENNPGLAYEIIKPYMQDLSVIDTPILDFYLGFLFPRSDFDEAERVLNYAITKKINPVILIGQSIVQKIKYRDSYKAEEYLKELFKHSPYDPKGLASIRAFYLELNKPYEYALFSYLDGIRNHSEESLGEALKTFTQLDNKVMIKKVDFALSLLKDVKEQTKEQK